MKVEVSRIKRPGVKVSVTLARTRRRGGCINIPVRAAAKDEICPAEEVTETVIGFADTSEDVALPDEAVCGDELLDECADDECVSEDEVCDTADELPEDAPDEEDLLALIAEEEAEMAAEMAAHQLQQSATEHPEDDNACAFSGQEPEYPDNEAAAEQPAQVEQYMRYFDRSTDGEKYEVADNRASGQEIICVDGESGRLSRVCGFIRNNQPAQPQDEDVPAEQE